MGKLVPTRGLSAQELQHIRILEAACCKHGSLNLKLNWDMLTQRSPDEINDFLYFEGDVLIGFLGLYGFGSEIEMTGMVHPDHRRQGIFLELFQAAVEECRARSCKKVLLVTEHSSEAGIGFVKHIGSRYVFSEYRMKFAEEVVPDFPQQGIALRRAGKADFPDLIQLDMECFGLVRDGTEYASLGHGSIYIVEKEGKTIGKIGVSMEGESRYIFGFGIRPENRGRGYGREVLSRLLLELLSQDYAPVILEVAVENENALTLYRSCGFREVTVYDYYELNSNHLQRQ